MQFLQTLAPGFDSSDPTLMTTECVICRDVTPMRIGILPCGHIFCSDCIRGIANSSLRLQCPLCRMTIRPTDISHVAVPQAHDAAPAAAPAPVNPKSATRAPPRAGGGPAQNPSVSEPTQSARMFSPDAIASSIASLCPASSVAIDEDSHLVEDEVIGSWSSRISGIVGRLLRIRRNFPSSKTIVFSQWNDVLDLVQECATLNGIQFLRLRSDRSVIKTFREDPACSCMLLLLKSGANGLNLTEATHVILCEPTLSPGVHAQAIARVQRIGQTQQTHVWRNVASGTVEESVVKSCASSLAASSLQSKKVSLASESLTLQALDTLVSEAASSDGILIYMSAVHFSQESNRMAQQLTLGGNKMCAIIGKCSLAGSCVGVAHPTQASSLIPLTPHSDAVARMHIGAAAVDRANGIVNDTPRYKSIVVHGRYHAMPCTQIYCLIILQTR